MNKPAILHTVKFLLIAGILGGAAGYFVRIEAGVGLALTIAYFMQGPLNPTKKKDDEDHDEKEK